MKYQWSSVLVFGFLSMILAFTSCRQKASIHTATLEPSLKQKIGQMMLVGFRGTDAKEGSEIYNLIKKYNIGGVVLYNYDVPTKGKQVRNIESPEQLKSLTDDLQSISENRLIISIDEEGGKVSRLKEAQGFQAHYSHQKIGELNDIDSTRIWAKAMARELNALGINMNFGPCVDLNINPDCPVIGGIERSFSADPNIVTTHAKVFIEEHRNQNIVCVPKHFPGHGSALMDSHKGLTDVTETWDDIELKPYQDLISNNYCDIVMTAHVYNEQLDTLPGTLSHKIINQKLKHDLKWNGLIISDDMQMGAINQNYGFEEAVEMAVLAGVDILILSNNSYQDGYDPLIAEKAINTIYDMIEEGKIKEQEITKRVDKIQALKF